MALILVLAVGRDDAQVSAQEEALPAGWDDARVSAPDEALPVRQEQQTYRIEPGSILFLISYSNTPLHHARGMR